MAIRRIIHRYDTAAEWTSVNPVLAAGELGAESDTHKLKVGDGVTAWVDLPYYEGPPGEPGAPGTVAFDDLTQAQRDSLIAGILDATTTTSGLMSASDKTKLDGVDGALAGKADTSHSHAISGVTGLQTELDAKAATTALTTHTGSTTIHVTSAEKTAWSAKLSDAPSDGKQYARKDEAWLEVAATATVPAATTSTAGIIRIATPAEISAGKSKTTALPPAGMLPAMWDISAKWTQRTLPASVQWYSVCWSPELSRFCAVCNSTAIAATSPDGITWTQRTMPVSGHWTSVCWSPELSRFCAVCNSTAIAATSPDGITWTQRTLPASVQWYSVCWSPELSRFCAVSNSAAIAATSPDGITWTQRTMPVSGHWTSVCWSPELSRFCAVAYDSAIAATSPDGITWTQRTMPASVKWKSVCWSPELSRFCAVAYDSAIAATSPDGITWTQRTMPVSGHWTSVCWSPELSRFCAVAYDSAIAATSPDGITWTQRTMPVSGNWASVCWSPELSRFCAVSNSAAIAATYGID